VEPRKERKKERKKERRRRRRSRRRSVSYIYATTKGRNTRES
jgi:hypothetical protein